MFQKKLIDRVKSRFTKNICKILWKIDCRHFIIAGGVFQREFSDIDLFFNKNTNVERFVDYINKYEVTKRNPFVTDHSISIIVDGMVVQLCKKKYKDIKSFISEFDFAHTQIAVEAQINDAWELQTGAIVCTDNFVESMLAQDTFYTGGWFPIHSVFRAIKFRDRGLFASEDSFKENMLRILQELDKPIELSREIKIEQLGKS